MGIKELMLELTRPGPALELRRRARDWLVAAVPEGKAVTSDGKPYDRTLPDGTREHLEAEPKARFQALTRASHEVLEVLWKNGETKTTCNLFVAVFSSAMQIGAISHLDPREALKKHGRLRAWVPAGGTDRPKCGDIVLHLVKFSYGDGFHVDVSLEYRDDSHWVTVDAGQGGPIYQKDGAGKTVKVNGKPVLLGGHDVVKRCRRSYDAKRLVGWVDIAVYDALANPARYRDVLAGHLRHLWLNEDGDLIHPHAPAGRGGPGTFRVAGPTRFDPGSTALWHPDAPSDPHLAPWA